MTKIATLHVINVRHQRNTSMKNKILILLSLFICSILCRQQHYPFSHNKKFGIVNTDGIVTVEPKFDIIYRFGSSQSSYTTFKNSNYYGVLSSSGEILLDSIKTEISIDSTGSFAWYQICDIFHREIFSLSLKRKFSFKKI